MARRSSSSTRARSERTGGSPRSWCSPVRYLTPDGRASRSGAHRARPPHGPDELSRIADGTELAAGRGMLTKVAFALALVLGAAQAIAEGEEPELAPAAEPEPTPTTDPEPSTSSETTGACGNGVVDPGEICDDGNTYSGDGCSATCSIDGYAPHGPACGDGTIDDGEECDDGNAQSGDGCTSACDYEA
ncbi:MAG: DUF4215 domain-containing protein [Myxococcales bacterium]|nr:DUF4215 domain-containing protein [Myxococcales bacterium]